MVSEALKFTYRAARRTIVFVIGGSVLVLGIALIVLPGPALLVIPAGLAILALEFVWARRWMRILEQRSQDACDRVLGRRAARVRVQSYPARGETYSVGGEPSAL